MKPTDSKTQGGVQDEAHQGRSSVKRILLLCLNGSRTLKLEQLDLIPNTDDQILFQDMRRAYIDAKKNQARSFHPDTPKAVVKLVYLIDRSWAELQRYLVLGLTCMRANWLVWWVGDSLFYVPKSATFVRVSEGDTPPPLLSAADCLPPAAMEYC